MSRVKAEIEIRQAVIASAATGSFDDSAYIVPRPVELAFEKLWKHVREQVTPGAGSYHVTLEYLE